MEKEKKKRKLISESKHKKRDLSVYIIIRTLVILTLIIQIIHKSWESVFICILTLALLLIPSIVEKKLNIELPKLLEAIILIFIFSAEILGEIQNFYGIIPYWDTILHTINGFIMAGVGFSLIDILNERKIFSIELTPIFVAIVAFSFSMMIGVMWEFFEYTSDQVLWTDMQKDRIVTNVSSVKLNEHNENKPVIIENIERTIIQGEIKGQKQELVVEGGLLDIGLIDTMKDLEVNFLGAVVFSILGYIYKEEKEISLKTLFQD